MFHWERDLPTLTGAAPFEFRLKRAADVHPQLPELLEINWDERWQKVDPHATRPQSSVRT